MTVLDSSALLAFLYQEPGHKIVADSLADCCMSTVNLAEVLARYRREGKDSQALSSNITNSSIEIVPFTSDAAEISADLLPLVQHLGLSLGDRACLALAKQRKCAVLTADRIWLKLSLGIEILAIR